MTAPILSTIDESSSLSKSYSSSSQTPQTNSVTHNGRSWNTQPSSESVSRVDESSSILDYHSSASQANSASNRDEYKPVWMLKNFFNVQLVGVGVVFICEGIIVQELKIVALGACAAAMGLMCMTIC